MKKLTNRDIQFIDKYLKNSGVEYLDIRMEMTDHVASEIENRMEQDKAIDFYNAFKIYMVQNKKNLIKNATKHRWSVDLKVVTKVKNEIFKPPALLVVLGMTAILNYTNIVKLEENTFLTVPLGVMLLAAYFVPIILYYKLKISFLNRLSIYAYLINYFFFLFLQYFEPSPGWLSICYSLLVWVNFGIVLSAFKLSAYYKKQLYINNEA